MKAGHVHRASVHAGNKPVLLAGRRFGRLRVLERLGSTASRNYTWLCLCDCGELIEVPTPRLQSGQNKSCGCYRREDSGEKMRQIHAKRLRWPEPPPPAPPPADPMAYLFPKKRRRRTST